MKCLVLPVFLEIFSLTEYFNCLEIKSQNIFRFLVRFLFKIDLTMYINRKQIPYPHICQDFYITSYYILQVNILILSPVLTLEEKLVLTKVTVEELKKDIILKDEKIHRLLGIIRKYEDSESN